MFEKLEARTNRLAMQRLANATATIDGVADPVPVIFDAEYRAGAVGVGMGASAPQMVIANDQMPAGFLGMRIQVNGAAWRVEDFQPDSELPSGLSLVILEKA